MVRPVRFELTTTGLKGRCSTVELRTHFEELLDYGAFLAEVKSEVGAGGGFEPPIFTL